MMSVFNCKGHVEAEPGRDHEPVADPGRDRGREPAGAGAGA